MPGGLPEMTESTTKYPILNKSGSMRPNGLYNLGWYLGYTDGNNYAVLDGEFSAADLLEIAQYILDHASKG